MVQINLPPPLHPPDPVFSKLNRGSILLRIFDPTRHNTQALTFRHYGALHRFDHQRFPSNPAEDPDRGIYYAAFSLSGCLVESRWGDTGIIDIQDEYIGEIILISSLNLLDLRGLGAMRSGSVAALAKTADRYLSQAWSRYFYDNPQIYTAIDGIRYCNAHNDEDSVALYERSKNALRCNQVLRLDHPQLRPGIQQVAKDHNMIFVP